MQPQYRHLRESKLIYSYLAVTSVLYTFLCHLPLLSSSAVAYLSRRLESNRTLLALDFFSLLGNAADAVAIARILARNQRRQTSRRARALFELLRACCDSYLEAAPSESFKSLEPSELAALDAAAVAAVALPWQLRPAEVNPEPSESCASAALTDAILHEHSPVASGQIQEGSDISDVALLSRIAQIEIREPRLPDAALPPPPPPPSLRLLRLWPDALLTAIVTFVEPVDAQLCIIEDAFS